MAHVIHLSLLLAVSLLPCVSVMQGFPNGGIKITHCDLCAVGWNITQNCNCTVGKWIWKFKCGDSRVNQVTLEATKLSSTGMTDYPNTCPKITYKTDSFLLSVEVEHGCVKFSGRNQICGSCNSGVTSTNNCNPGRKIHISVSKPDKKTVKIHFQNVHEEYDISDCIDAQTASNQPCNVTVPTRSAATAVTNLQFYHENKSWIDALEDCQQNYSSLVEITNQTVNDEVKSLLQNETDLQRGVWIGLERSVFGKDREWMWISRSKDINPKWNSSIADSNNHCAKMILTEKQVQLLDANCHDRLPFICQDFGEDAL
ncbi:uncharacterized protein LOC102205475 [Pundamilia nyererei]|uniref:Uncharacterized protein LOC102205475 n=1 Tax=Pundamilia nyererei TaxID=303518 RepID=A0A9Y3S1L7_9CICH|nr:PREDICTED: uncharacterized protein LOC102205475 [Pundamilia nyererei]